MTREEALDKLELDEGASAAQIEQSYQELYNEFQMRITNAPTEHQRKLYQQKLDRLEEAYVFLTGNTQDTGQEDLPSSAQVELDHKPEKSPSTKGMTDIEAMNILDLEKGFDQAALQAAYGAKVTEFQLGITNAVNEVIKQGYETAKAQASEAFQVLLPLAGQEKGEEPGARKIEEEKCQESPIKEEPKAGRKPPKTTTKKKTKAPVMIVVVVLLLTSLALVFKPWETSLTPEEEAKFLKWKENGDFWSVEGRLDLAKAFYDSALSLQKTPVLSDSLTGLAKRMQGDEWLAQAAWWEASEKGDIASLRPIVEQYPDTEYGKMAKAAIARMGWIGKHSSKQYNSNPRVKYDAAEVSQTLGAGYVLTAMSNDPSRPLLWTKYDEYGREEFSKTLPTPGRFSWVDELISDPEGDFYIIVTLYGRSWLRKTGEFGELIFEQFNQDEKEVFKRLEIVGNELWALGRVFTKRYSEARVSKFSKQGAYLGSSTLWKISIDEKVFVDSLDNNQYLMLSTNYKLDENEKLFYYLDLNFLDADLNVVSHIEIVMDKLSIRATHLTKLDNDDLIVGGSSINRSSKETDIPGKDVFLTKIRLNGAVLWERKFGGNKHDYLIDAFVDQTEDTLVLCYNSQQADDQWKTFLVKMDMNGNVLWEKEMPLSGRVSDFSKTGDRGFIMAGASKTQEDEISGWLLKVDKNGDWQ